MNKIFVLLIMLCLFMSTALAEWTQIGQGVYMDNMSVNGKTIKISYKYTRESEAFNQELDKYKLNNMKMYGTNNSLIFSDNNDHRYNENPQIIGMCYAIQE